MNEPNPNEIPLAELKAIECAKKIGMYDPETHAEATAKVVAMFREIIEPLTTATFYGRLAGIQGNQLRVARMNEILLNRRIAALRVGLQAHHDRNLEKLVVYFQQDGKPVEMETDLGEAYSESALCEQTTLALRP